MHAHMNVKFDIYLFRSTNSAKEFRLIFFIFNI